MKRMGWAAMAAATIGLGAASAALSIKAEMKTVVDPASNLLFAIGGEVDPANGPGQPPTTAARWAQAARAAGTLKSVAASMTEPARAKDQGDWIADAKLMETAAAAAQAAALARNGAGLADAANNLGDTCTTCHTKYKPKD